MLFAVSKISGGRDAIVSSTSRFKEVLANFGVAVHVVEFSVSTHSAADAARAVACDVAQIAKSIIFRSSLSNRPVLVMVSGANRVSPSLLKSMVGEPVILADPVFVKEHTGYSIGGVAPIGHPQPIQCLIDQDLLLNEVIWVAAGTPNAVFRISPSELCRITSGIVGVLKKAVSS